MTGVKKTYLFGGVAGLLIVLVVLNFAASLVVNLVGFVYPMYASFKAIETHDKKDDTKWLTYWVIFSFFSTLDYFSKIILHYVPFYYLFKLGFLFYLVLPQFNGAELIYERFVKDFFKGAQGPVKAASEKAKEMYSGARKEVDEKKKELFDEKKPLDKKTE